jgi:hypothetical protein
MGTFKEYISLNEQYLTEKKNTDVIEDFLAGKKASSTKHLYIRPTKNGLTLVNYSTVLVYKPHVENVYYMNKDKYSVTTSKIQSYIRGILSGKNVKEMPKSELDEVMSKSEEGDEV